MKRTVPELLAAHAEDIALLVGVILLGAGAALKFGAGVGLMTVGVLAVAYGVWITERSR